MVACAACGRVGLSKTDFSASQLKRKAADRRCRRCCGAAAPGGTTPVDALIQSSELAQQAVEEIIMELHRDLSKDEGDTRGGDASPDSSAGTPPPPPEFGTPGRIEDDDWEALRTLGPDPKAEPYEAIVAAAFHTPEKFPADAKDRTGSREGEGTIDAQHSSMSDVMAVLKESDPEEPENIQAQDSSSNQNIWERFHASLTSIGRSTTSLQAPEANPTESNDSGYAASDDRETHSEFRTPEPARGFNASRFSEGNTTTGTSVDSFQTAKQSNFSLDDGGSIGRSPVPLASVLGTNAAATDISVSSDVWVSPAGKGVNTTADGTPERGLAQDLKNEAAEARLHQTCNSIGNEMEGSNKSTLGGDANILAENQTMAESMSPCNLFGDAASQQKVLSEASLEGKNHILDRVLEQNSAPELSEETGNKSTEQEVDVTATSSLVVFNDATTGTSLSLDRLNESAISVESLKSETELARNTISDNSKSQRNPEEPFYGTDLPGTHIADTSLSELSHHLNDPLEVGDTNNEASMSIEHPDTSLNSIQSPQSPDTEPAKRKTGRSKLKIFRRHSAPSNAETAEALSTRVDERCNKSVSENLVDVTEPVVLSSQADKNLDSKLMSSQGSIFSRLLRTPRKKSAETNESSLNLESSLSIVDKTNASDSYESQSRSKPFRKILNEEVGPSTKKKQLVNYGEEVQEVLTAPTDEKETELTMSPEAVNAEPATSARPGLVELLQSQIAEIDLAIQKALQKEQKTADLAENKTQASNIIDFPEENEDGDMQREPEISSVQDANVDDAMYDKPNVLQNSQSNIRNIDDVGVDYLEQRYDEPTKENVAPSAESSVSTEVTSNVNKSYDAHGELLLDDISAGSGADNGFDSREFLLERNHSNRNDLIVSDGGTLEIVLGDSDLNQEQQSVRPEVLATGDFTAPTDGRATAPFLYSEVAENETLPYQELRRTEMLEDQTLPETVGDVAQQVDVLSKPDLVNVPNTEVVDQHNELDFVGDIEEGYGFVDPQAKSATREANLTAVPSDMSHKHERVPWKLQTKILFSVWVALSIFTIGLLVGLAERG